MLCVVSDTVLGGVQLNIICEVIWDKVTLINHFSVRMEVSRKQCDGDSVNKKNTKCEQIEKLHIKKKWSDVVVGKSINR